MDMTGEYRIPASRQSVWAALNDPKVLKAAIPGCQELHKLSDNEMTGTVLVKIGPVKASLSGWILISNIDPPNSYTIAGEGTGVAGMANGSANVELVDDEGGTRLPCEV